MRKRYWKATKTMLITGHTELGVQMIMAIVSKDTKRAAELFLKAERITNV